MERPMATRRQILDALAGYLEYELDEGRSAVECNPRTVAALGSRPSVPTRKDSTITSGTMPEPRATPVRSPPSSAPSPAPASRTPDRTPSPSLPEAEVRSGLEKIAAKARACKLCDLHKGRKQAVPGQGNPAPDILFVGEAPGADEDEQGLAFVGAAGQLLTQMITAMGYTREQVFIANVAKCRPPNNRQPLPEEMAACLPYLKQQIHLLAPRVIVALGATAVKGLLDPQETISRLRGKWQTFEGIPLMPTFHPAYLLRNPSAKRDVWADLKAVLASLGRQPPPPVRRSER